MATTVGVLRFPDHPVAITDGKRLIQFDAPADMADYLARHPEVAAEIERFSWTELKVT